MSLVRYNEKLARLCDKKGWDQADLWRAVASLGKSVSRSTVSNWWNGLSRPDMDTALHVARALGVPLDYLADDAQDEPARGPELSDPELAALKMVRSLKLDEAEVIRRLAAGGAMPTKRRGGDYDGAGEPL